MNRNHVTISTALVFLFAGAVGAADAKDAKTKTRSFQESFSGSYVNAGTQSLNMLGVNSTLLGESTLQRVDQFGAPVPGSCPNGDAGLIFTLVPGTGHGVARNTATGALIFQQDTSSTVCLDLTNGIYYFSGAGVITGGTGRFAGATGSYTFKGSATDLYRDAAGNFFGEQSGTDEGAITILSTGEKD